MIASVERGRNGIMLIDREFAADQIELAIKEIDEPYVRSSQSWIDDVSGQDIHITVTVWKDDDETD